jgi:thiosulfate dehydrogenase [quinone] large subunit
MPVSLAILRAFLGVTFVYAGVQKLTDPNFLHAGSPDYIGSQLRVFAHGSPIGAILLLLDHVPVLTGLVIAIAELAIGIGSLLGIGSIPLAIGGFAINMLLTLSATWHVHPYFLGSDSMYAVAWLAYGVGLVEVERRRLAVASMPPPPDRRGRAAGELDRRGLIRGGIVAGLTLLVGGASKALAGPASPTVAASVENPPSGSSTGGRTVGGGGGGGSAGHTPAGPPSTPTPPPVRGKTIANLDSLSVGDAVGFSAPGQGPCVLVRIGHDKVDAYSRICTHAGCEVGYDSSARLLVCPCHGAEFDPAQGARPVAGPAPTPLASVRVELDPSTGDVVLPR